jgi:flavin-binding protein dodecin
LRQESKECRVDAVSLGFLAAEEDAVSVYRVTDLIGTSTQSWEDAAASAVNTARKSLRDLRVAEVVEQDLHIGENGEITFRTKLRLSFKYEAEG